MSSQICKLLENSKYWYEKFNTIKNKVFQEVKSGRIVVTSPEDFARHAGKLVESVTTYF